MFSTNNSENLTELEKIRQMLLSRHTNQILECVEKIMVLANEEAALCEMLRADILEYLCIVMPFDMTVLRAVCNCLLLMAKHSEFYTQGHFSCAICTIIRSLSFLMKNAYNEVNFNQCLTVLATILNGCNTHEVNYGRNIFDHILKMLLEMQETMTPTIHNTYQIGLIILSLIDLNVPKWKDIIYNVVLTCFSWWFNFVKETLEWEHPKTENLILLCSTLSHFVVSCFISNESSVREVNAGFDEQSKNEIIFNVCEFLINFGTPYFENLSPEEANANQSHLEKFYQTIMYFYSDNLPYKSRLTHGLSEVEFLQLTAKIISFYQTDEISRIQMVPEIYFTVIVQIILTLSEDDFVFPEVWPSGRDNYRKEIEKGMLELPPHPSQWLDSLISTHSTPSCQLALLLYLYFFCMTAKRQDMLRIIYPFIVTFIRCFTGVETPLLLVKIIWFIFVMSQLSVAENVLDDETEATDNMVSLLETQKDLSLVYTHHPAILYWPFSSKVNSEIQTKIVHLWLRNKTPDCKELQKLIRKFSDVSYAILNILQIGGGQELDSAFSLMKTILVNSEDDKLVSTVWVLLSQVLANFPSDATSAKTVDYLIELASLKCPKNYDTRISTVASLLPKVLLQTDLISVVPSLTLVYNILQLGLKTNSCSALFTFLLFENFVKKLIDGLSGSVSDISLCTIRIITLLWKECGRLKNPENQWKIRIGKEVVLKVLETNSEQVLSAALDFIQEMLASNFHTAVFVVEHVDFKFVEILFLEIQNICIRVSSELSAKCWQCLKQCLHLKNCEPLHLELITNPLLCELIRVYLSQLKDSKHMMDFLIIWINLCNKKFQNPRYSRRIFGQFYAETVQMIERNISQNFVPDLQDLLHKVLESDVVLHANNA